MTNKIIIVTTLVALLLVAFLGCNSQDEEPKDYASAMEQLNTKKKELLVVKKEIRSLEKTVAKYDTTKQIKDLKAVQVITLNKEDFKHFIEIQSEFKSDNAVKVSAEMGGRFSGLTLDEGDRVSSGQYIGKVDTEQLSKQLEELNKSHELAQDVYLRQERLWNQNIGTEIQYLQVKNNKERLEKGIASLNLGFLKAKIYAPISGVVEFMNVENGEMIAPGQPLFTISKTDKFKLIASVPESYIKAINKGQEVKVYVPSLEMEFLTKIKKIGNSIHPTNRTIQVEMMIANKSGYIKPNMMAIMHLKDYEAKDRYSLPLEYVQQGFNQENFVYLLIEKDGKYFAKKTIIEIGRTFKNDVEILGGIDNDTRLITIGSKGLIDGEEIIVDQNKRF